MRDSREFIHLIKGIMGVLGSLSYTRPTEAHRRKCGYSSSILKILNSRVKCHLIFSRCECHRAHICDIIYGICDKCWPRDFDRSHFSTCVRNLEVSTEEVAGVHSSKGLREYINIRRSDVWNMGVDLYDP